ncbi:hypothetical protein [Micromonospora sp. NPDC005173]
MAPRFRWTAELGVAGTAASFGRDDGSGNGNGARGVPGAAAVYC